MDAAVDDDDDDDGDDDNKYTSKQTQKTCLSL